MNVLYISYDGALDPLGRSQVIPYLEGLTKHGHRFDLISFEKPQRWARAEDRLAVANRLKASDIRWRPLSYHKRLSAFATAYDLAHGFTLGALIGKTRQVGLVHARSYPATLIAWRLSKLLKIPFVFDMRGFYADERTEGGMWPENSALYRLTKRLERAFLRDASAVITLTQASVPTLKGWIRDAGGRASPVVIPTCTDTERFRPVTGAQKLTLAYVGSIGSWYMLDEMLAFGKIVLEQNREASLRFITNDGGEQVRARALALGVDAQRFSLDSVSHERVPQALDDVAATFHFIRPTFSKTASAATKFGESLALGLPVVVNPGVGDSAAIVAKERVGVVIPRFDREAYADGAAALVRELRDPELRARCRAAALQYFSLSDGVAKFASVYESFCR